MALATVAANGGGRCTCEEGQQEGEGGGGHGFSVMQTPRHFVGRTGEARGGRGWLAGGGYGAGAHCSVLWSMQMAGMAIFKGPGHVPLCLGAALDALGWRDARWGAGI